MLLFTPLNKAWVNNLTNVYLSAKLRFHIVVRTFFSSPRLLSRRYFRLAHNPTTQFHRFYSTKYWNKAVAIRGVGLF